MTKSSRQTRSSHPVSALLIAIVLLLAGLAIVSYAYLRSYTVFASVEKVARVVCRQEKATGDRWLEVSFVAGPLQGQTLNIPFYGDEWVLEGRVVKWQNLATFFGVKRYYRYERISGRYVDVKKERDAPRTVYPLVDQPDRWWYFFYTYQRWIPFVDAAYGNSAFIFFRRDAVYEVNVTPTGFMIRDITLPRTRPWWSVG